VIIAATTQCTNHYTITATREKEKVKELFTGVC